MSAIAELPPLEHSASDWLMSDSSETALLYRSARDAQRIWSSLTVAERAQKLCKATDPLMDHMQSLADLIVEENGKPRVEAIGHDVGGCIATLKYLCATADATLAPQSVSPAWLLHRKGEIQRSPFGLVLVISPWNIPLAIPFGQVIAGLIAGNAVVLKPSEVTPRIGAAIADILSVCGLPANLFTVVQGDGPVGAALVDERPDKIFFTGSVATGRRVMAAASAFPIPVSLELGGVDALIVLEDADLDLASSAAVWGATFNGGQVCASVERILVDERIADRFEAQVLDKLERIIPGQDLGRITMPKQAQVYQRHMDDARQRGLDVSCGGERLSSDKFAPTLVSGPGTSHSEVHREETFGPLVSLVRFRGDRAAVRSHNQTRYGLTASVFSTSLGRADRVAQDLNVGLVSINDVAATLFACAEYPWGGVGESGFGRSHGAEGLLEFTRAKVIDRPRKHVPNFKRPWWYPYDVYQRALITEFTRLTGARSTRERAHAIAKLAKAAAATFANHPRR